MTGCFASDPATGCSVLRDTGLGRPGANLEFADAQEHSHADVAYLGRAMTISSRMIHPIGRPPSPVPFMVTRPLRPAIGLFTSAITLSAMSSARRSQILKTRRYSSRPSTSYPDLVGWAPSNSMRSIRPSGRTASVPSRPWLAGWVISELLDGQNAVFQS